MENLTKSSREEKEEKQQRIRRKMALAFACLISIIVIALFCGFPAHHQELTFAASVIGAVFALYQFHRHIEEVANAHEWNRRKAAAEVNSGFLAPHIQAHWQRIYEPVIHDKKTYSTLAPAEQASVRELLTYLESVGLLLKHSVVDREIVFELLGDAWPTLYRCASTYIIE